MNPESAEPDIIEDLAVQAAFERAQRRDRHLLTEGGGE